MKHLKYICLIPLLVLLLSACGKKQASMLAEIEEKETEIQREDSLIRTQDNPTEEEIEALTDSAKQEKQRALMENTMACTSTCRNRACAFMCSTKRTAFFLRAALLAAYVAATNKLRETIARLRVTFTYPESSIVPIGYIVHVMDAP